MPLIPQDIRAPYCPYCNEGVIVKDVLGNMYCNVCFQAVEISLENKSHFIDADLLERNRAKE